jgi:hypothetical protein
MRSGRQGACKSLVYDFLGVMVGNGEVVRGMGLMGCMKWVFEGLGVWMIEFKWLKDFWYSQAENSRGWKNGGGKETS